MLFSFTNNGGSSKEFFGGKGFNLVRQLQNGMITFWMTYRYPNVNPLQSFQEVCEFPIHPFNLEHGGCQVQCTCYEGSDVASQPRRTFTGLRHWVLGKILALYLPKGNYPSMIPAQCSFGAPTIRHLILPRQSLRQLCVLPLGPLVRQFRSRTQTFTM